MMSHWVLLFALTVVGGSGILWLVLSQGAGSPEDRGHEMTITGVIERLDLFVNKGLLKPPMGRPVSFEIVKPELFTGIAIGQRVTLQLDEHGRAVKAIEFQSIPEVPTPAQYSRLLARRSSYCPAKTTILASTLSSWDKSDPN